MQHLSPLINDLALILVVAAITSFIFKRLKQPVVLGYILAGFFIGPYFTLFPSIVEKESINTWAEIGVLFLLFGLGLEFSFKKMMKVGGTALLPALMGIGLTMLSGYLLAYLLGWSSMDSLFLGGLIAVSSTTIIYKAYEELGVINKKFAGIVMGVLVIEDIFAVVLMVVLSTIAVSRTFEGTEMIFSLVKLLFFLVLWFVTGIYFIPSLLKHLRKMLNEESLIILSIGLCFLMVVLAAKAGFSPALGAFIMGSILAETIKAEKIAHSIKPLQNLFGAVFFVSVGMLINPKMLVVHALPIFLITLVLLFGKPLFVTIGALFSGQTLKVSLRSGMSLSQIGEFSFIIATLGLTLDVTSDFLYPIAVAVSVITTFTTPYMIKYSELFYQFLELKLPQKWQIKIEQYSKGAEQVSEESDWKKFLKFYFSNTLIFSVVIVTIIIVSTKYVYPLIQSYMWSKLLFTISVMIALLPFLWALAFRLKYKQELDNILKKPLERGPIMALMLGRIILALFMIGFLFNQVYSPLVAFVGVCFTGLVVYLNYFKIKNFYYQRIESRFLSNLNQREEEQKELAPLDHIAPWDSHIAIFEIKAGMTLIGKTLQELLLREKFGINIAMIKRDDLLIQIPQRHERIYPNDVLSVIGTDDQLNDFGNFLSSDIHQTSNESVQAEVSLYHFTVEAQCVLIDKSIRNSRIRELTHGLIVGVERNENRILNPDSDFVFKMDDVVWIAGNEKRVQIYLQQIMNCNPKT